VRAACISRLLSRLNFLLLYRFWKFMIFNNASGDEIVHGEVLTRRKIRPVSLCRLVSADAETSRFRFQCVVAAILVGTVRSVHIIMPPVRCAKPLQSALLRITKQAFERECARLELAWSDVLSLGELEESNCLTTRRRSRVFLLQHITDTVLLVRNA